MSEIDPKELLERAAGGDRDAAGELAQRYEGKLRAAIRRKMGQHLRRRVDTDDLFQSTISAAIQDLPKLESREEGAFIAWLMAVAERRVLMAGRFHAAGKRDLKKQQAMMTNQDFTLLRTSPSQGAARNEQTADIRSAVTQLADPDRSVVELRSFEGLGFKEIAERLELKDKDAARYIYNRALKQLGRLLDKPPAS